MTVIQDDALAIDAGRLREAVAAIFTAAGCDEAEGARIARYLVESNLTGHDSHGVIRVSRYVYWLDAGTVHAGRHVKTVMDGGAVAGAGWRPRLRPDHRRGGDHARGGEGARVRRCRGGPAQ